MQVKTSISPVRLTVIILGMALPLSHTIPTAAQTTASENTLALCETPDQTIRIYRTNGETLMRAYNRQDGILWMNRTPVSAETLPQGTRYTNQFGEQTVTTFVSANGSDCTIQLGNNAPEAGTLLQNGPATSEQILNSVRQLFPDQVAQLEAECPTPSTLDATAFQNEGQPPRANFICWGVPDNTGARSGQGLGSLPLTTDDPTFIQSFTCPTGDQTCESQLEALQSQYPEQLEAAELACSVKRGTLFFSAAGDLTDLRCGFQASSLWDLNGDGSVDQESSASVDVSVGQVPL
ncbi:hypothetical protein [Nodosilinea sp. P-1105]|uniref:hypothetical protein n=1 Tax=Nodosilinea sp. P-1105 TaxID=2546229 RepID=UPI00146BD618|nr:hypothetical protein [Nodosilinea sp. P-1105]NMF86140.1 hypothetical protein [Nodosilinea sp. P-1105]